MRFVALIVVAGVALWAATNPEALAHEADRYRVFVPGLATGGYPGTTVIGHSVEGQPIRAIAAGEGPVTVVLVGGMHAGPEAETADLVSALLDHYLGGEAVVPEGVELIVVPNLNPDGYVAGTRTNANGVDLNRNWPAEDWEPVGYVGEDATVDAGSEPLSEPGTLALYELLRAIGADLVISWHGYAALVEANNQPSAVFLGRLFADQAEYEYIDEWVAYPITGQLIDALDEDGIAAFDVELQLDDDDDFERNVRALDEVLRTVATAQYAVVQVDEGCLNARAEPSDEAEILECFEGGTVLRWTGQHHTGPQYDWLEVVTPEGVVAWAAEEFLTLEGGAKAAVGR